MQIAGLDVETLEYSLLRCVRKSMSKSAFLSYLSWDARWWSLSILLTNGTTVGIPTTGYWPYSGDSGLKGVTGPLRDSGTFGLLPNEDADPSTLDLSGLSPNGSIIFFDNPSPTHNYSEPGYGLLG